MSDSLRPPVILQVLPALHGGGVERGTIEMVQAIAGAGGVPLVASRGGRLVPLIGRAGGRHSVLPLHRKSPWAVWRNARRLAALIRAEGVALVHARSRAPAWAAWLACRATGVPLVTTWHGVHHDSFPGKRLYNGVLARGERVIAISHFMAARLTARYGLGQGRLRIIPRGADTRQFDPACVRGDRMQALAEAWDLPDDAAVIMLPARLTRWKGHLILIEALARLAREDGVPPWVCVFVGEGARPGTRKGRFTAEIVARARAAGIGARIRFAGHCQDMPAALMLARVVVVPSLRPEPFGRAVIEAQAMERVVIVANHGGAAETVIAGQTGIPVPPDDAQALCDALRVTLDAPDEALAAMGWHARQHVLAHFTTTAMQQATLRVYDEVLGTALAPAS
ncbi:glycosyltransferase [Ameyamaea chiangmaiensis NBRC 103196]|uniref:Glycosyltransferase family 4 protein n=1 Tax=Ameyamaea chiangmaiensis TaxID=442969 RepID=A0A850PH82_9PROT|nr:glycosyltransferase family 4 protein [Ameyamaea chiangmaiensis]MBS4074674.1 glycosyltransferase family 4 protein [Ameyamaea chiangmaiensis]NVN42009.1 glycosyltransferase family 4 protein [Ameyamaea chiangmaiensis]GBQ62322.1 glycosyltransferase [Ameyamaea chiangmaiensis NBRC 103196]